MDMQTHGWLARIPTTYLVAYVICFDLLLLSLVLPFETHALRAIVIEKSADLTLLWRVLGINAAVLFFIGAAIVAGTTAARRTIVRALSFRYDRALTRLARFFGFGDRIVDRFPDQRLREKQRVFIDRHR